MAINFPTSLDTLPKPANGQPMNQAGAQAGDVVSDMALAIEALQAKVGANSSAVTTSLDYFRASVRGTGGIPAGAGVFTSLTLGGGGYFGIGTTVGTNLDLAPADNMDAVVSAGVWRWAATTTGANPAATAGVTLHLHRTAGASAGSAVQLDIPANITSSTTYPAVRRRESDGSWSARQNILMEGKPANVSLLSVSGTQVLSTRKTGWSAATGTATRTTFATGSVTLPQLAERVKAMLDDFISHGALGA
jgi:hypothetical protein